MAELVAAIGVPHSPHYPAQFPKDGPEATSRSFRAVKQYLDAAKPDAIVMIANDHFNTFFLDNFPTFAIGVAEAAFGPNDKTRMPHYDLAVHEPLAAHLLRACVQAGFDLAVSRKFGLDHAMVPLWVNAFVKPLPSSQRCYALGQTLKAAIASLPQSLRVAVLSTGSFSLEIEGPRVDPGSRYSVPDMAWSRRLHRRIGNAEFGEIVAEATPEQMWKAGNIGGELLNWIVMLGTVGQAKPSYLAEHDDEDAHAYAAWSFA
jgi:hypothetical protein